ncbi:hypothetical protein C7974DRAFT_135510 [Boeremia exigua]|uniref:uncharacterized protein n=1 Tax=Boeremia exigua TaxID=749465 RepID=UPI001E8DED9D|nr:uncharacterized protein C7974DRAFT_135510 [Boeremia exigua]KAH6639616.1 hypothetical protein C7974DRAFT_135510 [Boeremia exigua]
MYNALLELLACWMYATPACDLWNLDFLQSSLIRGELEQQTTRISQTCGLHYETHEKVLHTVFLSLLAVWWDAFLEEINLLSTVLYRTVPSLTTTCRDDAWTS